MCYKWNYQESEKAIQRMRQIFVNHVSTKELDSKTKNAYLQLYNKKINNPI